MLYYDYKTKHDFVVISIHLKIEKKYQLVTNKKLKGYDIQKHLQNDKVEVRVDTPITLDNRIKHNYQDIVVFDHKNREIKNIEIGITSINKLKEVEVYIKRKYYKLANQLASIYKYRVEIIPFVMTWDGIMTKYNKLY